MFDTSLRRTAVALVLFAAGVSSVLAQTAQPLLLGSDTFTPLPAELIVENDNSPAFGDAVAIRGNRAVTSMFSSETSTRLAIFERDPSGAWQRTGTIETPTGFNLVGHSLALGENRIFLGLATNEIQAFVRSGNGWVFEQEFFSPGQSDPVTPKLAFDQGWLVTNVRGSCCLARVNIHARRNGTWSVVQTLSAGDEEDDPEFGRDFAIEGNTLVVSSGAGVRIYRLNSAGLWVQRQLIAPPAGAIGFGAAVAIGNGLIAIGAPSAQILPSPTCGTAGASGAVYVYAPSGSSWVSTQVLSHRFADCHFRYGIDVAITGTHVAVKSEPFFLDYEVIDGKTVLYRRMPAGAFSILGRDRGFYGSGPVVLSPTTMMVGVPSDEVFEGGVVSVFELAQIATPNP